MVDKSAFEPSCLAPMSIVKRAGKENLFLRQDADWDEIQIDLIRIHQDRRSPRHILKSGDVDLCLCLLWARWRNVDTKCYRYSLSAVCEEGSHRMD